MHRIDGPGATVDHKFTEGDPAAGVPATTVTDDFLNDVQENICKVIDDASIALVKGDAGQLKAAIGVMIGNALSSLVGLPAGYCSGFTTSNNASAPNTTVDVAAGVARSSANTVDIKQAVTLRGIIQASGGWAAGDNQNKLDVGARAPNTWYHPFVMRRTSDGQADHLWSASLTAPTVPPGYDSATRLKGRSIKTDGAGNIVPFINTGNSTTFKSLQQDMFVTNVATTSYTLTVSVPPGVRVRARFYARTQGESSVIYVRSPEAAAAVLGNTATDAFVGGIGTSNDATSNENVSGYCESLTNQSAQVVAQVFGYVGYNVLRASLHTIGWTED
ncbi:hypothetical protein LOY46_16920 [Pseudomonas sichuanensis]|uniref:hypothetical protein n=1 Tax=Pseudomonas sichuanensis TaxID=2213015 RepID=UPI00215E76EF|nr:hypothetical protein [Pseudomonas sichuanensis]UVK81250.1 hypothetical protein LOY46_16920 [Pseudomonas sichuanensis]